MQCDTAKNLLDDHLDGYLCGSEQHALASHIQACAGCREVLENITATRKEFGQVLDVPAPDITCFDRAITAAIDAQDIRRQASQLPKFWLKAGFGSALAASLVIGLFFPGFLSIDNQPASPGQQEARSFSGSETFATTLNARRDLSIAINTDHDMTGVRMSVSLLGEVILAGYEDQREISWRTDLVAGVNKLTLPVIAVGRRGGSLLLRIERGDRIDTLEIDLPVDPLDGDLMQEIPASGSLIS
jgi:hypothetical protein